MKELNKILENPFGIFMITFIIGLLVALILWFIFIDSDYDA